MGAGEIRISCDKSEYCPGETEAWNITNRIKLVHVLLMTMELREAYVELMIELEEIRLKEKYGK
ncbi:MAG: hypothetical protein K6G13_08805 [Agathobacter sp.]|uniref:hypothetical protein n=1 Tax=Agathobacter sp. TaxID=2021311 RepID=UPI00258CC1E6|nr:hypothetical protein [Agathobacter sp.]MCR5678114.1 hypothetical protein [Agathobacter sp.]